LSLILFVALCPRPAVSVARPGWPSSFSHRENRCSRQSGVGLASEVASGAGELADRKIRTSITSTRLQPAWFQPHPSAARSACAASNANISPPIFWLA